MSFNLIRNAAALVLGATVAVTAWAGPTRAEAQAQSTAAVAHVKKVGLEQAVKDFNTAPEWKVNGMNVFLDDMNGVVLASSLNERIVGKNLLAVKDPSGKEFTKEAVATAKKGGGWVEYQFFDAETKKIEERAMVVRKLDSSDHFIGIGITTK